VNTTPGTCDVISLANFQPIKLTKAVFEDSLRLITRLCKKKYNNYIGSEASIDIKEKYISQELLVHKKIHFNKSRS
jgi:hypothetical protein